MSELTDKGLLKLVSLKELESFDRWILYPAASGVKYFMSFLEDCNPELKNKIVALCDRDTAKWGLEQEGKTVLAPATLNENKPDLIILCSPSFADAMTKDLVEKHNVGVRIVLADTIAEYLEWESRTSSLATVAKSNDVSELNLTEFDKFFQSIPFASGVYPSSKKGVLTYQMLDQVQLPQDMKGKSVLELGASDCFYSFECMARGAEKVTAAESFYWEDADGLKKLELLKKHFGYDVGHLITDANKLTVDDVGQYDITLALGLFYHLRDPFLFFRNMRKITKDRLILSGRTVQIEIADPFLEGEQSASFSIMSNKSYGKWTPNTQCLVDMLLAAGFNDVEVVFDYCPKGSVIASTAVHALV